MHSCVSYVPRRSIIGARAAHAPRRSLIGARVVTYAYGATRARTRGGAMCSSGRQTGYFLPILPSRPATFYRFSPWQTSLLAIKRLDRPVYSLDTV
eukprot:3365547-Rhodomonas_salina.2